MSTKEEIAQRLIDQCDAIETSRKKIEESVQKSMPKETDNVSAAAYRRQIEQCRRALVSSQENAKLKQEKMETTINLLRKEVDVLRMDLKSLKDCDKITTSNTTGLQRELMNAREWAQKAKRHAEMVNEENVKLRQTILQMKRANGGGFWNRGRRGPATVQRSQQDPNNTPTRSVLKNFGTQIVSSFKRNGENERGFSARERLDFSKEGPPESKAARAVKDLGTRIFKKPEENQTGHSNGQQNTLPHKESNEKIVNIQPPPQSIAEPNRPVDKVDETSKSDNPDPALIKSTMDETKSEETWQNIESNGDNITLPKPTIPEKNDFATSISSSANKVVEEKKTESGTVQMEEETVQDDLNPDPTAQVKDDGIPAAISDATISEEINEHSDATAGEIGEAGSEIDSHTVAASDEATKEPVEATS